MQWKMFPVVILILAGLNGCASIGPGTMARDRFDYTTAISDSWKAQMLLNVVKLRYADAPVFLDVASVISQYGFSGNSGSFGILVSESLQIHCLVRRHRMSPPRGSISTGRRSLTHR